MSGFGIRTAHSSLLLVFFMSIAVLLPVVGGGDAEVTRNKNLQQVELEAGNGDVTRYRNLAAQELSPNNADITQYRNLVCLELEPNNADVTRFRNLVALELAGNDLAVDEIKVIQVVSEPKAIVVNKKAAACVTVISSFAQRKWVNINVTYDFGTRTYPEMGPYGNGTPVDPGVNRIYIPGGPVFSSTGIDEEAWMDPYSGDYLYWSNAGTDSNIRVAVDPENSISETNEDNNELVVAPAQKVVETNMLSILFVPVNITGDPANLQFDDASDQGWVSSQVSSWLDFVLAIYPVSEVQGFTMWPPQVEPPPGSKPWWYLRSQDSWEFEWLSKVTGEWMNLALQWGYDRVVLLFRDVARFTLGNNGHGMALGSGQKDKVPIVLEVPYFQEGLAHEVGHTCFLWHAHDRGPDVFLTQRFCVEQRSYEEDTNTFMSYRYGGSQDMSGNQFPMMWIDKERYDAIANSWTSVGTVLNYPGDPLLANPIAPSSVTVQEGFRSWNLLDQSKVGNDPVVLLLNGVLYENGSVNVNDAWHILNGTADLEEGSSGNYAIVMKNETGQIVKEFHFNSSFTHYEEVNRSYVAVNTYSVPFIFRIPYNETVRIIELVNATGHVLYTRSLTAHSPVVEITYPTGGELLNGGLHNISWDIYDADGDSIVCSVAYSVNGGATWRPLAMNLNQGSFTWDTSYLESGTEYLVKVIATDGVNTGEDVSDSSFTVDADKPTVGILSPEDAYYYSNHIPLTFNLSEPTTWTGYSLDDQLNVTITGNMTLAGLTYGVHRIAIYATDVAGNTGSSGTFFFTVTIPGDVDHDHDCDIFDIVQMAGVYGVKQPDPRYNPTCDIDSDGDVDIFDLVSAAGHYGEEW